MLAEANPFFCEMPVFCRGGSYGAVSSGTPNGPRLLIICRKERPSGGRPVSSHAEDRKSGKERMDGSAFPGAGQHIPRSAPSPAAWTLTLKNLRRENDDFPQVCYEMGRQGADWNIGGFVPGRSGPRRFIFLTNRGRRRCWPLLFPVFHRSSAARHN